MLPIVGLSVVIALWRDPALRPRLLPAYIVTVVMALPAALIAALSDRGRYVVLRSADESAGYRRWRSGVIGLPFGVGLAAAPAAERRPLGGLSPSLLVLNLLMLPPRDGFSAWSALLRRPNHLLLTYTSSSLFVPGATYRILRVADGLHTDGKVWHVPVVAGWREA